MTFTSRKPHVLLAACVILALVGLLAVRLLAGAAKEGPASAGTRIAAPPATVPPPPPIVLADLKVPAWGVVGSEGWPLRFRTNLDLLAPLGNGAGNVAEWFKDFAKPDGARVREAEAALARRVQHPGVGGVLPADDPLLLEAEPWMEQATMRFYPDIFPLQGYRTQIPNLLLALTFARSWYAQGSDEPDPVAAAEDFRRIIRLGRLLRQDDVVVISDLVGLACIRMGSEGLYDLAVKRGDATRALVAAVVLGEPGPQRLLTKERLARTDLGPFGHVDEHGRVTLQLPEERLAAIIEHARHDTDRRFRCEAAATLDVVRAYGTDEQRAKARGALEELAAADDPLIAAAARWNGPISPDDLKGFFSQFAK